MLKAIFEVADFSNFFSIDRSTLYLVRFSLYQAFLSTILSLVVGVVFAWSLWHKDFFAKELLITLLSSSLVLPSIIIAFGIISIYGHNGWLSIFKDGSIYGLKGILLAHIYLNGSYATKALLHSFETISHQKYKVSASLGLSAWEEFWYIEWVAIRTTLKSIGVTIFLLCFSSFAIILLLGGTPAYNTLEVAIYEAVKIEFDLSKALKYASIQLMIASLVVIFASKQSVDVGSSRSIYKAKSWIFNKNKSIIQGAIIALFALFFITPLISIVIDGASADFKKIVSDEIFIKSIQTSIVVATISSSLSIIATIAIADLKRTFTLSSRAKDAKYSFVISILISFFSNIYLSISSLILGVGFFLVALWLHLDQTVVAWIALIVANVLLTLPFSLPIIYPIMHKTALRYDKITKSLGIGKLKEFWYVDLANLKSSIIYIFALSFCFSLGDLGIIALFGSSEFSTLPWYLYSLLGTYQNQDASGVALIMLILTLFIFIAGEKFAKSR